MANVIVSFPSGAEKRTYEETTSPKYFFAVEDAGHNNVAVKGGSDYWEMIRQFAKRLPENVGNTS